MKEWFRKWKGFIFLILFIVVYWTVVISVAVFNS